MRTGLDALGGILDLIFPRRCAFCAEFMTAPGYFCEPCAKKLAPLQSPVFDGTGFCFDKGLSFFVYDEYSKQIVFRLKYDGVTAFAEAIAELCMERIEAAGAWASIRGTDGISLMIPMPLHKTRRRERGFNQSELIGRHISKALGLTQCPEALIRVRNTRQQSELSRAQRRENMRGAFAVNPKFKDAVSGAGILLFDDIFTTGATLDECSSVLKAAGAREILVMTFLKTMAEGAEGR